MLKEILNKTSCKAIKFNFKEELDKLSPGSHSCNYSIKVEYGPRFVRGGDMYSWVITKVLSNDGEHILEDTTKYFTYPSVLMPDENLFRLYFFDTFENNVNRNPHYKEKLVRNINALLKNPDKHDTGVVFSIYDIKATNNGRGVININNIVKHEVVVPERFINSVPDSDEYRKYFTELVEIDNKIKELEIRRNEIETSLEFCK